MQVLLDTADGRWHRPAIGTGGRRVACGKDVPVRATNRKETYEGALCEDGCFSPWELGESIRLRSEALDRVREEQQERERQIKDWEAAHPKWTAPATLPVCQQGDDDPSDDR